MEQDEMTQTELKSYLETLAKLVEATAKDPQDAARIIREAIPEEKDRPPAALESTGGLSNQTEAVRACHLTASSITNRQGKSKWKKR